MCISIRRTFIFLLLISSFNSYAYFATVTYVRWPVVKIGDVVDVSLYATGGNYVKSYCMRASNQQILFCFDSNVSGCPEDTIKNSKGVCEPEEKFCDSDTAINGIAAARNECPSQDKFTFTCDNEAKSYSTDCVNDGSGGGGDSGGGDSGGGDSGGGDSGGGDSGGGDSGGGDSGGNGTDSNGNNGCVINCDNSDTVDPTKTFCSSSAANSKVNSARAYCAMRAGGNNFNFIIQSCSELTKKVNTKCEIDKPDSGGGDSGGDGSGTTDPDNNNSDNSDIINKLSKLDSANILGLDALKKTNTDGFNGIGKLTKEGFDTIDKTNKDGFGELGKTTKDGFDELGKTTKDGFGDLGDINKDGFDQLGEKLDGIGDSLDTLVDGFSLEKTSGLNVPDHKKVLNVDDIIKLKKDIVDKNKELNQTIKTGFDDLKQSFTLNVSSSGNDSDLGFTLSVAGHSFNVSNPLSSWSKYYNELGMVIMMLASMSAVVIVCSKN